jgi:hypothetical protein
MNQTPQAPVNAFTTKWPYKVNRIITAVKVAAPFDPTATNNPPIKFHETLALWDTGATNSVITKSTADTLVLLPTGQVMIHHAGGKDIAKTYVVNFILPNDVGIAGLPVSECPKIAKGDDVGAIIGMDIISAGDLSITNYDNKTWVSFCLPSHKAIDYVKELNELKQLRQMKIGRNDPCWCGSGKKYKKCHGA